MSRETAKLLTVYLLEADNRLAEMDEALDTLAATPADAAACRRLGRALHTIKGNSAMMGLESLVEAALAAEHLVPGQVCGPATLAALRAARAEIEALIATVGAQWATTTTPE